MKSSCGLPRFELREEPLNMDSFSSLCPALCASNMGDREMDGIQTATKQRKERDSPISFFFFPVLRLLTIYNTH